MLATLKQTDIIRVFDSFRICLVRWGKSIGPSKRLSARQSVHFETFRRDCWHRSSSQFHIIGRANAIGSHALIWPIIGVH
jgi:hypothetical protein